MAGIASDDVDELKATITALREKVEGLTKAGEELLIVTARAFERIHSLPRTSDTALASQLTAARTAFRAALHPQDGGLGEARMEDMGDGDWVDIGPEVLGEATGASAPFAPGIEPEQWRTDLQNMPRDGSWFWAKSALQTRLVRYDDPDDRLPISTPSKVWDSLPTHWRPAPSEPVGERREAIARLRMLADGCDVAGLDHIPVVSRDNAAAFARDVRLALGEA